jgi:sugar phosphate isomerase/epimerase
MIKTLSAGAIGVKITSLEDGIQKSKQFGFDGYEFDIKAVAQSVADSGAEATKELFSRSEIVPAVFGLPVEWRKSDSVWYEGLEELPKLARAAEAIGCTRTATWVMPCSDERQFDENYAFHVARFGPMAKILGDHGISLGLEFIGPKTLRDTQKFPFVYKMQDMLALGELIGPNVGLLLDAYHWHTSHGAVSDIQALKAEQVVYVHLNDALPGVAIDELVDGTRCLPGETGVIDLAGFMTALHEIGYEGPVAVEPFKKSLNDLASDEDRLEVVSASLTQSLELGRSL